MINSRTNLLNFVNFCHGKMAVRGHWSHKIVYSCSQVTFSIGAFDHSPCLLYDWHRESESHVDLICVKYAWSAVMSNQIMKVVSPTRPLFMAGIFFPSEPTSQFPIAVDLNLAKTSIYIHVRRVTLCRLLPNMGNVGVWATKSLCGWQRTISVL